MNEDIPTYAVIVGDEAEADVQEAAAYIQQDSPQNATTWLIGVREMMRSLERFPHRSGDAREAAQRPGLRQAIYHSHRILYSVDDRERTVFIHRVIHASRNRWRS